MVSVIVVNYNSADLLEDCLHSLSSQTFRDFEIVVVDNGSNDASVQMLEDFRAEPIRLLRLKENQGFAAGCNRGLEVARGELVALLNNDAVADPAWLREIAEPFRKHPELAMAASKIFLGRTRVLDKAGHLMFWDGQNRGRGTGEIDEGQYDREESVFFPDGCAAAYRRKMLLEVGGFDEDFFAYADDADLGVRLRLKGWDCRYVPKAVVYHRHSATAGAYSGRKVYWIERNRFWLLLKSFPLAVVILSPLFTLYRWSWNLAAFLTGKGAAAKFRRSGGGMELVLTLFRAYRDGLRGAPAMWRKRKEIRSQSRISDVAFLKLLWRFRITARQLAFQDRPAEEPSWGD